MSYSYNSLNRFLIAAVVNYGKIITFVLTIINGICEWHALYQILMRGSLRVPFNTALGIIPNRRRSRTQV